MQTSVIGFPRIGTLRELKFASEKYFKKEISEKELLQTGKELRVTHWNTQKQAGIDYISCNDFSYYDMVLDTVVLFNLIPKRYKELNLSDLDTYFAMARGYQGTSGDVKALAMKNGSIPITITLFRKSRMICKSYLRGTSRLQNTKKQKP